ESDTVINTGGLSGSLTLKMNSFVGPFLAPNNFRVFSGQFAPGNPFGATLLYDSTTPVDLTVTSPLPSFATSTGTATATVTWTAASGTATAVLTGGGGYNLGPEVTPIPTPSQFITIVDDEGGDPFVFAQKWSTNGDFTVAPVS